MATGIVAAPSLAMNGPELVRAEALEYPRAAERRGIEGHVVVRYDIGSDGKVSDVEIVESAPEGIFDRSVERALSRWRFEESETGFADIERRIAFNLGN